jgi:hypothetical protein
MNSDRKKRYSYAEKNPYLFSSTDSPPTRILVLKSCVVGTKMPGASGALMHMVFEEGQIVTDPSQIQNLIKNNCLIERLADI